VIEFDEHGTLIRHELKKARPALSRGGPVEVGVVNWGMDLRTVIADW
jgi:hypothetical protein